VKSVFLNTLNILEFTGGIQQKICKQKNWALDFSTVVNYVPLECAVELVLDIQPGIVVATNHILSCHNIFRWLLTFC